MSVLTKSGQNQACKTQFQSVVCSDGGPPGSGLGPSVALWNNLWRSIDSFFSPSVIFTWPLLIFFLALKVYCAMENVFIYIN